jgi:dihydropyrimidine dehydrogenase (NAD+) subunit PreA
VTRGTTPPIRIPHVDEEECVGCNLCWLVCPVEGCITMEQIDTGKPHESWKMRNVSPPQS